MGYKFKASYSGSCKADATHTWASGSEVCYDKEKKIICVNLDCYLKQGGSPIEAYSKQPRKRLTKEEARKTSKELWAYAWKSVV